MAHRRHRRGPDRVCRGTRRLGRGDAGDRRLSARRRQPGADPGPARQAQRASDGADLLPTCRLENPQRNTAGTRRPRADRRSGPCAPGQSGQVIAGRHRKSNGSPPQPAALTVAVREAARFDRESVSVWAGLLAAIPVVALLGGGIAAGEPVAAVTMGAGAMLVGTAWRTGGGRPPLALMATDAVLMATSTFVGCVTGSVFWLHLGVLCVWSLMAGLLVGVGNRGAVVGTQAIIAVVVFGRFSQPPLAALGLAGLILAGGGAQVLFLSIVRWPSPLRAQRAATASAYRVLSGLAAASAEVSTLPAATALDEARGP